MEQNSKKFVPQICCSFIFLNNGKLVMLNPEHDPGIKIHSLKNSIKSETDDNVIKITKEESEDLSSFAVKIGIFKSKSEAKRNGWIGKVDPFDKRFLKKKITVIIE